MLEIRERQHPWGFLGLVLLSAAKTRESEVYKEAFVELGPGKKARPWGLGAEWKPVRKQDRLPQVLEGGEEEEVSKPGVRAWALWLELEGV